MESKHKLLVRSLIFDAIGMISYFFPLLGEYTDVLWAPISAIILYKMYPGMEGKIGSLINFAEEIVPFSDIMPTFTLTWIYRFIISKH